MYGTPVQSYSTMFLSITVFEILCRTEVSDCSKFLFYINGPIIRLKCLNNLPYELNKMLQGSIIIKHFFLKLSRQSDILSIFHSGPVSNQALVQN